MTLFEQQPELLARFRAGDRQVFEAVYRRYFNDVFRLLSRGFTSGTPPCTVPPLSEEQALEHLQEVFLRAFDERARIGYDGLRRYLPYLLRIAKNYRIDVGRRERRLVSEGTEASGTGLVDIDRLIDEAAPVSAPRYEEILHFEQRLRETRLFLASLSEVERRFVSLRFDEELPQAMVATTMGISRRKVRALEAQIQRQLQRHLSACGLAA